MGAYLPALKPYKVKSTTAGGFLGYNRGERIRENEFSDMANMCSDGFPLLSPRSPRMRLRRFTKPNGLWAHEALCWADGVSFYYGGEMVGEVSDTPKRMASMGPHVLIWPDKAYYNAKTGEFGSLNASYTSSGTVACALSKRDGGSMGAYTASSTPPAKPGNGDMWLDSSREPHVLKQYSSASGMWAAVPTTYVKISAAGIGASFADGDGVTISGLADSRLNGDFIIQSRGDGYIVVTALIDAAVTQDEPVYVKREAPDLDFIVESGNRLWGCSSINHEIYACKLGDPKNWRVYAGVATDSYAVTVGSQGAFTGAAAHLGYVIFFKEDELIKIFGSRPANYQLSSTRCPGVMAGCERSITTVNETLYYKARDGVVAYNSALPEIVSYALGEARYDGACAGAAGHKYYVSMRESGRYSLLAYDTRRGLWHREDGVHALFFARLGPVLYYVDDDGCLYAIGGESSIYADEDARLEGPVEWYAVTGDVGLEAAGSKYVSKLLLRIEVGEEALVRVETSYDGGEWEEACRVNPGARRTVAAPVIPQRCDTMRLRVSGKGWARIYSITKTIERGSEL